MAAAVAAAAAGVVSAGASVVAVEEEIRGSDSSIYCQIQVENWTKFGLTLPGSTIDGGEIPVPPGPILPTKLESMLATKSFGIKGSYGIVSWLVEDLNRRVVVMWSIPENLLFYNNKLGLGLTSDGVTGHDRKWFDQMNDNKGNSNDLKYITKEYNEDIGTITIKDGRLEVDGIMGSTHKSEVKITVRPKNNEDLADAIRAVLKKK